MGDAAVDASPVMEVIADFMMHAIGRTFDSQGRRGGGSWKRDSLPWLLRKQRLGLDPRIGHATQALRDAFSVRGAAHQILTVEAHSVDITTDLPYAGTEQRHRPFIKFTPTDILTMRDTVRSYLMDAWRTAR